MNEELWGIILYDTVLVVVVGLLAWFVTPWCLAGLLFLLEGSEEIEVTQGATTVTVKTGDLTRRDVRTAVEEATN